MNMNKTMQFLLRTLLATTMLFTVSAVAQDMHTSGQFQGPKANTGTVTHSVENGKSILRVSNDFKVPDTPAPTWRVVDSQGNVYTLDAFKIKSGNNEKREVVVPSYVHDIAKVQVYCAWAEILLGEASFSKPVM
jgi:hypothetical protein